MLRILLGISAAYLLSLDRLAFRIPAIPTRPAHSAHLFRLAVEIALRPLMLKHGYRTFAMSALFRLRKYPITFI